MSEKINCMGKFAWFFKIVEFKLKCVNFLSPLASLIGRLTMAHVFFSSGILKLPYGFLGIGKGSWDSTLTLFQYEYAVPILSAELAAYMSTTFEILCPVLLVIGLGTRPAAFILLFMTAVIEFTYTHSMDHVYWATILLFLVLQGGGKLSLDHLIRRQSLKCPNYKATAGLE